MGVERTKSRVMLAAQCGWIRLFESWDGQDTEGTLVYLSRETTVNDVCRDLSISVYHSVWIQIDGQDQRPLKKWEKPLVIQDEFLVDLGYENPARRTRLAIDPTFRHLFKYFIGPWSDEGITRGGSVHILKGLVLPQWRRRYAVLVHNKLFIYPDSRFAVTDSIDLSDAYIEYSETPSKTGRYVLKICGIRNLFLGFDTQADQSLWLHWFQEAADFEPCTTRLDLSNSGLEKIPETLVQTWPTLEELILSHNRYLVCSALSLEPIERLPHLTKLVLCNTDLTNIPSNILKLDQLRSLDVSDNRIASLSRDVHKLSGLQEFRVDRNDLTEFPGNQDSFPRLKFLSAAQNRISHLPVFLRHPMSPLNNVIEHGIAEEREEDFEQDEDGIIVERREPEVKGELTSVNLRSNQLKGTIILGNYGNLTTLDVSENSIESLDLGALNRLESIKCSRNQLKTLVLNGSSLISVIAGNNKLQSLIVSPRPARLQHLDISYNELESLPDWIDTCPELETIFASHNRITQLPSQFFCRELGKLHTLQLSFNRLTSLPSLIRQIASLKYLFLQSNSINILPQLFLQNSSKLKVLNISKNCLKMLPSLNNENRYLEKLYLTSNALTDIGPLNKCRQLNTLHVAYNAITSLPDNCISAWSEMEELVLSGNGISSLPNTIPQSWPHLRVLRLHSNHLTSCPSLYLSSSLRVLDLSYNHLERLNLNTLIPKQLQYLDVSGNPRLHVDPNHFKSYRSQRAMSLVDVSGQNRECLPSTPPHQEVDSLELQTPWTLGFSETAGCKERLNISQLRLPGFCNSDALIGIFDSGDNGDIASTLVQSIPRILLEERTVKETASDYMKYTMLTAHREIKDSLHRYSLSATLCHLSLHPVTHRYMLHIASVGEAKAILCRQAGSLTFTHAPTLSPPVPPQGSCPLSFPDPHVTEVMLHENDHFLILANKSVWDVLSGEEAVAEVRSVSEPVLAAKRIQDLAQSYGSEDNLSVLVLRFQGSEFDSRTRDAKLSSMRKLGVQDPECPWTIEYDRSSPSGQSDQASSGHTAVMTDTIYNKMDKYNFGDRRSSLGYRSKSSGKSIVDTMSASERSAATHLSEEQLRCWEYMLEKNTQMLFDKELDTLSKGFTRPHQRPGLWPRAKSVASIPEVTAQPPMPFLSRKFGSARSFQPPPLSANMRKISLNTGPHAAYFGSLQRIMPYQAEYDYSLIQERHDSMDFEDRMKKYWDVATTEL
ncbi:hypothetical protein M8J75_014355 [Diaphorina citri]|nr:hypothetical protein M8J75_014355 [Diaphorina citri]